MDILGVCILEYTFVILSAYSSICRACNLFHAFLCLLLNPLLFPSPPHSCRPSSSTSGILHVHISGEWRKSVQFSHVFFISSCSVLSLTLFPFLVASHFSRGEKSLTHLEGRNRTVSVRGKERGREGAGKEEKNRQRTKKLLLPIYVKVNTCSFDLAASANCDGLQCFSLFARHSIVQVHLLIGP